MHRSHLAEYVQDRENLKAFQQERLLIEIASLIHRTMEDKGITRKQLAESLGVTKGRVTQYLGGEKNLTLRTLADIFTALNAMLTIGAEDLSVEKEGWKEMHGLSTSFIPRARSQQIWEQCLEGDNSNVKLAG